MDFINEAILWLENNWGTVIFGTASLGTVVTTLVVLVKQWIGNKAQGTKYEKMWEDSQKVMTDIKTLYDAERASNAETTAQNAFLQASQNVMLDAVIKLALSSKLDSADKTSIVANVEHLKLMAPKEIIEKAQESTKTIASNLSLELEENPAQTVVNITNTVGTLLDKYTATKE